MAEAKRQRPISPHLQIYRWPVTMATSIAHRITGVGLYAGALLLSWWLIALASGPDAYALFQAIAGSILGMLILIGYTWALMYHLLNGLRHLHWDAGGSFDNAKAEKSGLLVFVGSVVLTAVVWLVAV